LIELYIARVEATDSVEERVSILRRVAQVNERDLGDMAARWYAREGHTEYAIPFLQ